MDCAASTCGVPVTNSPTRFGQRRKSADREKHIVEILGRIAARLPGEYDQDDLRTL